MSQRVRSEVVVLLKRAAQQLQKAHDLQVAMHDLRARIYHQLKIDRRTQPRTTLRK